MGLIVFKINGKTYKVGDNLPRDTTLSSYLRYHAHLPGTKAMCKEGGCGSCIVSVRALKETTGVVDTFSVNSCLVLIFSCHGWDITTIEGVGSRKIGYSDTQKRIAALFGTQCGYCTPGWLMSLESLLHKDLPMAELEKSFGSNTCRCTGYRPILKTIKSFASDATDIEELHDKCKNKCQRKCSTSSCSSDWSLVNDLDSLNMNALRDVIEVDFDDSKFVKVFTEKNIFDALKQNGTDSYMLVDGNTGKGIYETFEYPRVLIDISNVTSLKQFYFDQNLVMGANISLQESYNIFKDVSKTQDDFAYLEEFAKHIELVAHIPVREIGSLAGNLTLKNRDHQYQSDIFLLLSTVKATITIKRMDLTTESLTMTQFLNYNLRGVLIVNIELPPLNKSYIFRSYKVMPRNQNALAIVNAGFLFKLDKNNKVTTAVITYGNIEPDFIYAKNTEKYLKGRKLFNNETVQGAIKMLLNEVNPIFDPPEQSPECRRKLAIGLFYKFVLNICPDSVLSPVYKSGGSVLTRNVSTGSEKYETDKALYPLNKPVKKLEALIQASGEAQYVNDIPQLPNEVFGAFVLSTVYSGQVKHIDIENVMKIDGVKAVLTADDIPGKNSFTFPGIPLEIEDEEILASGDIKFYGQPIAIVVADREDLAAKVAKNVKVTYKNVSNNPPILTINEGKKIKSNYFEGTSITPTGRGTNIQKVIKGIYEIEAQYHYYLEPMSCLVVPVDKGLEVYDSTQWIDLDQIVIAKCLGIRESNVVVKVKRLGGGFGGKLSRASQGATACAVVANHLGLPCRFIMPLQTIMTIAGRRLPSQCTYEVGVDNDGKIQYLDATIVEDDGCSHNENILSYTAGGFPNCYITDNFSLKTTAILTNLPANTFCRAPGTNEGIASIENIMEHISYAVKKDATEVRLANMRVEDNDLPQLIKMWKEEVNYEQRAIEIDKFNNKNRWMKKSLRLSVMDFPVEFFGNYSALVSIYRGDASVTVTTGGIEMGQGVNTKVAQVCAYELGIPLSYVSVIASYSFVCANNVFSGSSIVSESVCYSVIRACEIIKKRLEPIKALLVNPTWKEIIKKAGEEEIDLTAIYMMSDKEPDLQSYHAYAVVVLEVVLDVLTGTYEILRCDILEDAGLSANPEIDIGQVQGGYIQGLGYYTTEKLVYDKVTGKLLTNRSLTYHVPLALDIPQEFNVKLRYNSKNPKGVLGSKAVGEMGFCTAHGINHVLRKCIYNSRHDSGYDIDNWIQIDIPYDCQSILHALDIKNEEMLITKT